MKIIDLLKKDAIALNVSLTDKEEAIKMYPSVQKTLDKLAKTNIIHKNKAANIKSKLANYINKLG